MLVLVFGGCEHVQGAVASACVVPDLDVVVGCARELDPSLPSFAVEQLDLHAGPERLDHRIVETERRRHRRMVRDPLPCVLAEDPGSELGALIGMYDSALSRCSAVQRRADALVTRSPVWQLSTDQPTTMRENASITAQQ